MRRTTRTASVIVASLAVLAIAAPGAFAKGGREGESKITSLPNPTPIIATCDDVRITSLPNPETLLVNPLSFDAGCLAVRIDSTGTRFTLAAVVLSSGWAYTNDSGSDGDRVKLGFSNAYTGQKFDALVTSGKTIIG
ncbi:MAG: hypothetical protein JWL76_105 [Thermoleophilia bacterium]|nr:hypothetical protein [Thermoleophilia bacterium]